MSLAAVSEMTYTVSSGTLISTIPYHTVAEDYCRTGAVMCSH